MHATDTCERFEHLRYRPDNKYLKVSSYFMMEVICMVVRMIKRRMDGVVSRPCLIRVPNIYFAKKFSAKLWPILSSSNFIWSSSTYIGCTVTR